MGVSAGGFNSLLAPPLSDNCRTIRFHRIAGVFAVLKNFSLTIFIGINKVRATPATREPWRWAETSRVTLDKIAINCKEIS